MIKVKPFLFLLTLFLVNNLSAQTIPEIDSLVNKGKNLLGQDDKGSLVYSIQAYKMSKAKGYYWGEMSAAQWIAEAYYYTGQIDSSKIYNDIALKLSEAENDLPEVANNLVAIAVMAKDQGETDKAIAHFLEAQKIMEARKDTLDLADLFLRLGGVYLDLERTDEAMELLLKAKDFSQTLGNRVNEAGALINMAIAQKKIGNVNKAIELQKEAITIFEEEDKTFGTGMALNNLGIWYKELGNYDEAIKQYLKAKELTEAINYERFTMAIADNMGILYNLLGKYKEAERELRIAEGIAVKRDLKGTIADAKAHLARSFYKQGKVALAKSYIQKSLEISEEIASLAVQKDGHEIAAEIYEGEGDMRQAIFHFKAHQVVKDSIYNKDKSRQINDLQTKYETAKKDNEITVLSKNAEIDKTFKRGLMASLVLLVLAAAAWIYTLVNRRKKLQAEKALELQKRLNAEQELDFKHKELTSKILQLARKNEFLNSLEEEIDTLKTNVDSTVSKTSSRITKLIKRDLGEDKQWEKFGAEFSSLHKGYLEGSVS